MTKTYEVKCSECRATVRTTENVRESYAGGTCDDCRAEIADTLIAWCSECKRDTRQERYDSELEGCARFGAGFGVHYVGGHCLECGDIDADVCIHD
jgi:hypothetical protein